MGISEAVDEFERDILEAQPAVAAAYESAALAGEARMRNLAANITFPSWPGATSSSALRRAAQESEITSILDHYALSVRDFLRPADVEQWRALVAEAQRRRGAGVIADELGRSTVGASLLRDRLGGSPRKAPQRTVLDCACGYAETGIVPQKLCPECGDVLLTRWVAEERRLLRDLPDYAAQVTEIITVTAQKQTAAFKGRGEYQSSDAEGRRRSGGRKLARLRKKHRVEIDTLDLTRWQSLSEPLTRDMREPVRLAAARAAKRGLGAAALTELGVRSLDETVRKAAEVAARHGWGVVPIATRRRSQ